MAPEKIDKKSKTVLYRPDKSIRSKVLRENDTVRLNRQQISVLFKRDVKTIGNRINDALKKELSGYAVVAYFATTATVRKTMPSFPRRKQIQKEVQ